MSDLKAFTKERWENGRCSYVDVFIGKNLIKEFWYENFETSYCALYQANSLARNINGVLDKLSARLAALEKENGELLEMLKPLALLDLVGVQGEIVYERNRSQIKVSDVNKAKETLRKAGRI